MFEDIIPIPTLLLIAAFLFYLGALRRLTAFSFALAGLLVLEILHQIISHSVLSLFPEHIVEMWGFYIWYLSFALTDFLYVFFVIQFVKYTKVNMDRATFLILLTVLGMGGIQILRMIDRILFDTRWIAALYTQGIPAMNMFIVFVALLVVIVSFFSARNGDA